jgi:putative membrane protein (TIGR04086 family)
MEFEQESPVVPIGPILYGCLVTLIVNLALTLLLAVLTELGWTATVKPYSNNLYLLIGYLSVIIGSIVAGRESLGKGWLTGLGVGVASSVVFMILNSLLTQPVIWGIFLTKTLINAFIGVFGGVIGINFAARKN